MRRGVWIAVALGLAVATLAPTTALAQRRGDWYYDVRPYVGKGNESDVRKARLWDEILSLRTMIRRLDRRGDITPRQAERFYDRLDRVAHFVRNDRNLTSSEFNRRRNDLRGIAQDLHRQARVVPTRYDERGRYTDRGRFDDRYRRSVTVVCAVCDGVCRYR